MHLHDASVWKVMRKYLTNSILLLALLAAPRASFPQSAPASPASTISSSSSASQTTAPKLDIRIPFQDKSIRFAVIGDSGTGDRGQYDVAQKMELYRQATKFDFVLMLGDNIYGNHSPGDFARKFEQPYKALLDA